MIHEVSPEKRRAIIIIETLNHFVLNYADVKTFNPNRSLASDVR